MNNNQYEELKQMISANKEDIIGNMNKLHSHEEQIQKNSYAREILESISKDSIKWYKSLRIVTITLIITLLMWFSTIAYLIFVLSK